MAQPLVSILLPAYNDEAFIEAALSSVAAQSLGDFEVIVADDCSKDRTVEIATQWARKDSRFRVLVNQSNLGMTGNWNRALREASGSYVIKLDADDSMRPRCLEVLAGELGANQDIHVAYCRTLDCDEHLAPYSSYLGDSAFYAARLDPLARHVRPGHDWYAMCFSDVQLWHSNAQMHRRANLLQLGGWDETWGCASDTDLILRILETGLDVCHNPYAGILYRHRVNSVSDRFRRHGWLKWESALIHLSSLGRNDDKGFPLNRTLRRAWWRYWRNWQALRHGDTEFLSGCPQVTRVNLERAAARIKPPPIDILIIGTTRMWIRKLLALAALRRSSLG